MGCELTNSKFVYHNNKFMNYEDAVIPVTSHSFNFGTGVFESLRIYKTECSSVIVALDQHIKCLNDSLKFIGLRGIDTDNIRNKILEFVNINKMESGYIRIIAYPDISYLNFDISNCSVNVSILGWSSETSLCLSPISLGVSLLRRPNADDTLPYLKVCGLYVLDCLAHMASKKQLFDDAIMLNQDGTVCKITGADIFIIKDNRLITPIIKSTIKGITREIISEISQELGLTFEEKDMMVEDLLSADEVFIAGIYHGLREVSLINGISLSNNKNNEYIKKIMNNFKDILNDKNNKHYLKWTTDLSCTLNNNNYNNDNFKGIINVDIATEYDVNFVISNIENLIGELTNKNEKTSIKGIEETCLNIIKNPSIGVIFISRVNGTPVGFISATIQQAIRCGGNYCIIQELWVDSKYRNNKIGDFLLSSLENYCTEKNIKRIEVGLPSSKYLDCFKTINFYNKNGFVDIGMRKKKLIND